MIDTRVPRAAAAPRLMPPASLARPRASEAPLSEHYYDDVLAKMSSSFKLLALDEAHNLRAADSGADDEAAGRMEWSLNM